ncbi:1-phosphatidylinositol 4,5-bisphosphate phosphodiesterase classes I and II-like isoform X4 [Mytilus californianus]|uniref:1-phosphatidylinositol 4,5-bisphosphate phosphodiesterase classes I and II-like isoform X4 n=1 Tax=Mytilus californianus TaxID=6549 RepID=UPI002247947A|nr:1-phosphatidylinositol 4,5-bisphosphate phosphodiesterase classes I and II-like isoform X4 [Mytilus californianus]
MAGAKPGVHVVQLRPIIVPECLIKGNKFIKWEESSATGVPVTLKVDPNGYILFWKDQNKEMESLDMSLIRDTRTGKYAKVPKEGKLKDTCMIGQSDIPVEDKTVTVAYGSEMTGISFINFVCSSRDTAKLWCDELLLYAYNLLAANGNVLTFLEKAHTKITHVLDVNGRIPVKNIVKMFATHRDDKKRVEKALESINIQTGKMDSELIKHETIDPNTFSFDMFFHFYRQLVGRTEVDKVFDESGAKKKPILTVDQFWQFLNKEQRDPRLNEILYPHCTLSMAQEYISKYETKVGMADKGQVTQEGFLKFLMGEENNVVAPELLDLSQEMTHPLAHYFINSSHNTYLTGHQLTGKSSVEMYRQVLLSGCRCIELDCWDGRNTDEEPIITHGYTMCTEIYFKEVIEAIAESAFKISEYPVVLSFENHCSPKQQARMATHCRNIFGDLLLTEPLDSYPIELGEGLPPPCSLMRKIIVKNKKKHFHHNKAQRERVTKQNSTTKYEGGEEKERRRNSSLSPENSVESPDQDNNEFIGPIEEESDTDHSEYDSDEEGEKTEGKTETYRVEKGTAGREAEAGLEMSELVNYIQPVHFHSFDTSEKKQKSYEISSFVETQATSLLKENPVEFVNYNKRQLSRIYPRGTRVDSSNFLPQIFWNAGCQMVALNFQTLDLAMQLNQGIFEYNNRSGYVLKPDFMRRNDRRFDPFAESTVDGIVAGTVYVKVISGQMLSDKKINTYVEVDMYGLPTDTVRKKYKTKTVMNNGINPVYDEDPFIFKKVVLPNLAVIRFAVYEENGKMLGHRVLTVQGLRPGYRHIPLRNEFNLPLNLQTLFVHICVKDFVPDDMESFAMRITNPLSKTPPPITRLKSKKTNRTKMLSRYLDDDIIGSNDEEKEEVVKSNGNASSPTKVVTNSSPVKKEPTAKRISGGEHQQVSTKISINSEGSTGREGVTIHQMTSINSENGLQFKCKLNDPSIIEPTSIEKLKTLKPYLKITAKRDKELETLNRKNEKRKGKHKELKQTQGELFVDMCKDQFKAELDIHLKYHSPIYDTLKMLLDINHKNHVEQIIETFEMDSDELKKEMETRSKLEMKRLAKTIKDKNELSRTKREAQTKHIKMVVNEIEKLKEILNSKQEELTPILGRVRQELEREKEEMRKCLQEQYEEKCRRLTEQFRDVGFAKESENTPL